jgi:uncharacterized membrane protein
MDNHKQALNVGKKERLASIISGTTMMIVAIARAPQARVPLALGGGYFLYRGITGKDPVYEAMKIRLDESDGTGQMVVTHSITVNRPRAEVYAFWRNFQNFPLFMKHLDSIEVLDKKAKLSHWIARAPLGMNVNWDAEIIEDRKNELITWQSIPPSMIENSGKVEFKDSPVGKGTEIDVSLRYSPPAGSASVALARLLGQEPETQIRDDLRRFKQIIETGEIATITGQSSGRARQVDKERERLEENTEMLKQPA